jgi:hypothetical protein
MVSFTELQALPPRVRTAGTHWIGVWVGVTALWPTQPPVQWALHLFPGDKATGAWR